MFRKAKVRSLTTRILAILCCLSMTVSVFAFFTDRVSTSTFGRVGNFDLVFTDISSSKTGENGITSPNEFAIDQSWEKSSLISPGAIINPGDYFDLSYNLSNRGSKSMDVRQQLIVTSTVPMTDIEEYKLTIIGQNNDTTAVTGTLSEDKLSIVYDLTDIILNGSVETEEGITWDEENYTVRLDFELMAGNAFMNSGVTVNLKAQAKQHRNTTDADWADWIDLETEFEEIDNGLMLAPSDTWYAAKTKRSTIKTINIVDSADEATIASASESFPAAADADGDGKNDDGIMGYINGTTLTLAGNGSGKIYMNPNSSWVFSDHNKSDYFKNVTTINGANVLDSSKATTFERIFQCCQKLKSVDVSTWDTSKVTSMMGSFSQCYVLEDVSVEHWDTSAVTTMAAMFQLAQGLTELDLSNWDVSNVTTMQQMLAGHASLGPMSITSIGDTTNWNTSKVTNMVGMFSLCTSLKSVNTTDWDVSNVTAMNSMFGDCLSLTTIGDTTSWNTAKVTNMKFMFSNCISLKSVNTTDWDVSNVTDMQFMFGMNPSSNVVDGTAAMSITSIGDTTNWNTANVTNMYAMFQRCNKLTSLNTSNWNTAKVIDMSYMFYDCNALTTIGDTSNWNTANVTNMSYMFDDCNALTTIGDTSNWNTAKVTNMKQMFQNCNNLTSLNTSNWKTAKVTDMSFMFYNCSKLGSVDVSGWNVAKVKTFDHMFAHSKMSGIDTSNWVTTAATNMNAMFHSITNETIDVSKFDTDQVTAFSQMFETCHNVKKIIGLENFNTANAVGFDEMFSNCYSLEELNLSSFNTTKAKNGVEVSENGHKSATLKDMFKENRKLKKVILGANFSFNGNGSNTTAANIGVLPTPNSTYITGADGNWYDANGTAYAPANIPTKTAGTYYAVKP